MTGIRSILADATALTPGDAEGVAWCVETADAIERSITANRWAAFTNDELHFLSIATSSGYGRGMRDEIDADLERRSNP
jgi:hypothetical protein